MKARLALLAVTVMLAGAAAAPAYAANAAPRSVNVTTGQGPSACDWGQICLYRDYGLNRSGPAPILKANEDVPWFGDYNFNDTTSSVCNFSGRFAAVFRDSNYEGPSVPVASGQCTDVPTWFNDSASSVKLY
ncbi:peptidase inhibitor family I36 protein [Streptomyces tubbatahanensis]|uniref:Peptidase inhibitor family I36 protein n=1 Tax=Streptomyces tubbatahanensis TaxID=2923272 RepID=A0ABY3XQV8_9ACTN|nr:peptidase inhibitor family I36 protein [Streptomyces tubbatahanensis]UNS96852.1 peptidase inhibitor family I36 protein [Streptomyces tubbatahanensis]